MNTSILMQYRLAKLIPLLIGLGVLACATTQAQQTKELISFTGTTWRYHTNNADQGTAWRARTFNDAVAPWLSGTGVFGWEPGNPQNYAPGFNTPFTAYTPGIITYYFRARYTNNASPPTTLICTNLVDDGLVIYLNGVEAGRLRVPAGQNWQTQAGALTVAEGQEEVITLDPSLLLLGTNIIAVEVHQNGTASSDVAFGMSMWATFPTITPMSFSSQPQSQTVSIGRTAVLSVGVNGGPGWYQWQANNGAGAFTNIPNATFSTLTNTTSAAGTNAYRVFVYNGSQSVTSSAATITVTPDTAGPLMLAANVLEEPTRTNRIQIAWDEVLRTSTVTAQSATNGTFSVILYPSNIVVGISNVQYNPGTFPFPGIPPTVTLTMNTTNWHVRSNYCIFVNNVRDTNGNVIAANSRICISWPTTTNVMQMSEAWDFFDSAVFVPNIYTDPWMAPNYFVDYNNGWGNGIGILYKDPTNQIITCSGDSLGTAISIQAEPTLFRRSFMIPANYASGTVQFKVRYVLDDGAVFFLNGKEWFRDNMANMTRGGNIDASTRAATDIVTPTCRTNDNQLVPSDIQVNPGMNWIAAAVSQVGIEDIAFGMELDLRLYGSGVGLLGTNVARPKIHPSRLGPNTMRMFWTNGFGSRSNGFGFALESTTTLPGGTWTEVQTTNSALVSSLISTNIYTATAFISNVPTAGPNRFYRLKQVQPAP